MEDSAVKYSVILGIKSVYVAIVVQCITRKSLRVIINEDKLPVMILMHTSLRARQIG